MKCDGTRRFFSKFSKFTYSCIFNNADNNLKVILLKDKNEVYLAVFGNYIFSLPTMMKS